MRSFDQTVGFFLCAVGARLFCCGILALWLTIALVAALALPFRLLPWIMSIVLALFFLVWFSVSRDVLRSETGRERANRGPAEWVQHSWAVFAIALLSGFGGVFLLASDAEGLSGLGLLASGLCAVVTGLELSAVVGHASRGSDAGDTDAGEAEDEEH
jgi:hypothetical protein